MASEEGDRHYSDTRYHRHSQSTRASENTAHLVTSNRRMRDRDVRCLAGGDYSMAPSGGSSSEVTLDLGLGWARGPVAACSTPWLGKDIWPSSVSSTVNIRVMAITSPSYWPPRAPERRVM